MSKRLFNETRFTTAEMLVAATVLSVALLLAPSMASAADLVSGNSDGTDSGNAQSFRPEFSADGRFVVFASDASNLVAPETNGNRHIFVRDLETKTTTLVTFNASGTDSANAASGSPTTSADGRFVVFVSFATDLVEDGTNGNRQIFWRDLQAMSPTTTLVSVNSDGIQGDANSLFPLGVSDNGRFVVFASDASNLSNLVKDGNGTTDVFVRDLDEGTTTLVSVSTSGTSGSGLSRKPVISPDGRFVAFESSASDLVALGTDTNGTFDVFVRDLQAVPPTTTLVSVSTSGTSGSGLSRKPVISADGRFVAFESFASDLVAPKTNGKAHIFVRDLKAGTTTLVSVNISGTSGEGFSAEHVISPDGRFVAFQSSANDLVAKDTNRNRDVFVRDLSMGTTTLVSVSGTDSANGRSDSPDISADGRFVAFRSSASNLASPDTDKNADVFARDLQTGITTLLSVNSAGTGSGNGSSEAPVISADGTVVAFQSFASDLVGTDNNGVADVFVSVLDQEAPAVVLIIDEDSIDNDNFFAAADINDYIAQIGLRTQLPFFAANVGNTITLHTGQMGNEGWFALKTIPASWGPTNDDGLRNFIGNPSQSFPHNIGEGLGRGSYPEALLDKIPNVTPLRADGLKMLEVEGRKVCAVVYDSDISINYAPLNGSLRGATLGTVAFKVTSVTTSNGFSSSSLPEVKIEILNAEEVCEGELTLFTDAPKPISSS